ncbi:hypothetical protein SAMN02745248_00929 [Hathewaya proteolytica DSM 3090]|uniref:Uncharacterized protein n=1 Tax=Hathewaya proteolytica DSM 3090 TaxID=1121331 RepID=A0A1M6M379_9CLOT|nr:hypothetical protein SAMN02745248_00929 [Hathewaya proteolytica DSM 3090]
MSFEKKFGIVTDIAFFIFFIPILLYRDFYNANLSMIQKILLYVCSISLYTIPIMKYFTKCSSDMVKKVDSILRTIVAIILVVTLFIL